MSDEATIRKYVLKNAVLHEGEARKGAIIGKLIAEDPENKKRIKVLMPKIQQIVSEVNELSLSAQREELERLAPELLEEDEEEEERKLPELRNAEMGEVVTRYPPEPSGFPHLGHALSFWINRIYADNYEGEVWLRFEDTNPLKAGKKFFKVIKEELDWLGLDYEHEKNISDDIPLLYEYAEKLLEEGEFYVCTCTSEEISDNRAKGLECKCRDRSSEDNMRLWKGMLEDMPEGEAVVRLKGDMESDNMDFRDPAMFRIISAPHCLQGTKYRVWPTYDFAGSVEDAVCGITHVLRSIEFQQRAVLQARIRELLGFDEPEMIHFARFELEGTLTSKRRTRALIEEEVVEDWSDPRLGTIAGLRRRGIVPETFRELALIMGPSKSEHTIELDRLFAVNKEFIDSRARRFFVVRDPVKLSVKNAPDKTAQLPNHPSQDMGERSMETEGVFFIEKSDVERMEEGEEFRLKELYNVRLTKVGDEVEGDYAGEELKRENPILHWVTENNVPVKVVKPGLILKDGEVNEDSLQEIEALGEENLVLLNEGEIFQMERFGFARVDSLKPLKVIFTSK